MFFGREYNREQLRKHCGATRQLARILACELADGKEKGVRCLNFQSGNGFNFTVLPDRGMDLAYADYNGRNLSWISPTSLVGPAFYEPQGWGWARGFFGGLLTTCGLVNVGVPDIYNGEPIGAHGRITYTPATNVSYDTVWAGDDLYLLARGEMRETRMNSYDLVLKRRIQVRSGDRFVHIHDTVINEGHTKVPFQILYHVNAGFPIVTRDSYIMAPCRMVTPRDQAAEDAKEHWRICKDPTPGFAEQVYYHDLLPCTDGRAWAAIVNPELDNGMGLYVKYDPQRLPLLAQWKMMGEGTYVVGLEPSNTYGINMERQQALGMLQYLEPEQHVELHLEIGVIAGADEIAGFEREISVVAPNPPDFASILV
jgi:hypothetical protein